ncbi:hypothetical protein N9P55_00115 [bacterium]|nr:hypothetical protein [bacterium]MDB4088276.1 hypothetical protein [Flavobacteriales bacterium]
MTETGIELGASFETIAPDAKAWVYTSNQEFSGEQLAEIEKYAEVFLSKWDSHGKMVKGNIQVLKNRFVAIFADTEGDTMCGSAQDASVRFVKELEEILNVKLMDRMLIAFNQNDTILALPFNQLREKIATGEVSKLSNFYNGLVSSKTEFITNWETPIEGSWL